MDKFMTTLIPYIPKNGISIVIVHPNVKIVKKNHFWANYYLQKCTNVGLKTPLMCTLMYNMYARSPKETWNNETMALIINHLKDIKIWGSYTPILGNIKKSLSIICY